MFDRKKILTNWLPLLGVTALFAFFRIYNLGHGIGTHPDERHMVMVAEKLSLADMNPHSFAYGSFPYYLLWLVSRLFSIFSQFYTSYDGLFWVGRGICVASGLIGVLLMVKLGKVLFEERSTALLAGLFLGLNVFHIQLSRFYTVDVVLATLCTAALIVIIRLAQGAGWKHYLLCGVIFGLAVASKITALFLFAPLGIAWIVARVRARRLFSLSAFATLALLCIVAIVTFLCVEPYALLDSAKFLADSREQTSMVRGEWRPPYTIQFAHTAPYFYHLRQFIFTMGWPMTILVIAGTLFAVVRAFRAPRGEDFVALAYLLPTFFLIGGFQVKFPRYMLPLYPVFLCYAAQVLVVMTKRISGASGSGAVMAGGPAVETLAWSEGHPEFRDSAAARFLRKLSQKIINFIRTKFGILLGVLLFLGALSLGLRLYRVTRLQLSPGVFTGGLGATEGYFKDMMGVAVAPNGNIFVVDMYNNRVQKFDERGRFLLTWGTVGSGVGQFNEPRGIAVDTDSNVYVVDTWNGRVQKFDNAGNFQQQFLSEPGLFGPKAIAVKGDKVFVSDTGGGRVVVFDMQGRQLLSIGTKGTGPEQLLEPVGVTVSDTGEVLVVDSANNRIQIFSQEGVWAKSFPVSDWTDDHLKEAYLAMGEGGDFYLADPISRSVKFFSLANGFIRAVQLGADSPSGIALYNGRILVGDRARGRILQLTTGGEVVQE